MQGHTKAGRLVHNPRRGALQLRDDASQGARGAGSSRSPAQNDEKFNEMLKVLKGMADQQKAMEQTHEESMAKTMKEIGDLRSRIGRTRPDDRERGERGPVNATRRTARRTQHAPGARRKATSLLHAPRCSRR